MEHREYKSFHGNMVMENNYFILLHLWLYVPNKFYQTIVVLDYLLKCKLKHKPRWDQNLCITFANIKQFKNK